MSEHLVSNMCKWFYVTQLQPQKHSYLAAFLNLPNKSFDGITFQSAESSPHKGCSKRVKCFGCWPFKLKIQGRTFFLAVSKISCSLKPFVPMWTQTTNGCRLLRCVGKNGLTFLEDCYEIRKRRKIWGEGSSEWFDCYVWQVLSHTDSLDIPCSVLILSSVDELQHAMKLTVHCWHEGFMCMSTWRQQAIRSSPLESWADYLNHSVYWNLHIRRLLVYLLLFHTLET